jgi:hypothetical protein
LTTAAGEIFLGDPRYAQLIAMINSAVLIVAIAPGRVGMLLAAMLLFTPRSFYVLEMSWTEPISLMLLVATVFFAMRVPVVAPIALGLLIASKQYLPAALFLLPLMSGARHESRRAKWGFVAVAVGVATAVTLPLAVWDFRAFWQSVVTLQFKQPYRPDALSFLAWWGSDKPGWQGPFWACFVALGIGIGLSLWRARSFALGFALSFLAFFAFNKQAFANYYYLVLGALFCAIACENCISRESPADKQIIGPCADSSPLSSPP